MWKMTFAKFSFTQYTLTLDLCRDMNELTIQESAIAPKHVSMPPHPKVIGENVLQVFRLTYGHCLHPKNYTASHKRPKV